MNYLAIKSTGDLLLDKIKVLNVVFKPLGYTFMKDEDTDKVLLIENNKNRVCLEENDYESSNGINRYILDNSRTLSVNFDNLDRLINAFITDDVKGSTHIFVQFEDTKYLKKFNLIDKDTWYSDPTLIITNFQITMNDYKYKIDYYQSNGMLSFGKYNGNDNIHIGMSRSDGSDTLLTFSSYINNQSFVIASSGNELYHNLSLTDNLEDKSFKVQLHSNYSTGKKMNLDLSTIDKYKHYSNSNLINNKNVRDILDEVVNCYNEVFPYNNGENILLGGYLYNAYTNGKPNDEKLADNFLEAANISIKNMESQRVNKKK